MLLVGGDLARGEPVTQLALLGDQSADRGENLVVSHALDSNHRQEAPGDLRRCLRDEQRFLKIRDVARFTPRRLVAFMACCAGCFLAAAAGAFKAGSLAAERAMRVGRFLSETDEEHQP
ncbi:hypothetical protein GCM10022224_084500 [Nonomuraea antimicrobica]|uniref:Uncharacterized protein n=1 Tax=Nonomuraea antimicrobica TaxID=561173 RepID=A0ABP7DKG8_9ACTN